jgi:hypothetical protein
MLRTVKATRYVTPFREGGSLPGLCEADDDGLYVVKFRGAGQGPKALAAEVIAGELGRALGLLVPEQVLVELDPALGAGEPLWEVKELLDRSPGTNLGVDFLPGALAFAPAIGPRPDPAQSAAIAWFDALVTNPDRSARNVNLLTWHGRVYCIDHGAALFAHHRWEDPAVQARRPFPWIAGHVLLPFAAPIPEADDRLAPLVTPGLLTDIVAAIPDAWLAGDPAFASVAQNRAAYVTYLLARLAPPREFVEEAERARIAA